MKKRLLKELVCPNFGTSNFHVYGIEIARDGKIMTNLDDGDLLELDDIKEGVVVDFDKAAAYPISEYVLSMLNDEDVDLAHYQELFGSVSPHCPSEYSKIIEYSLNRIAEVKSTDEGNWNREEMVYYDEDVATPKLREAFLQRIKSSMPWHIYLERGKHLVGKVNLGKNSRVLEVGCGNARSMAWLAPPKEIGYEYVGIDISWKRLLLAKSVLPEGDFVQASALALPFSDGSFSVVVAFGSLHHLPDTSVGFVESIRIMADDGKFLLHEPIIKRSFLPEGKYNWLRNWFNKGQYEHSDHDNEIDLNAFGKIIEKMNLEIAHEYFSVSLMRAVLTIGPMRKVPFFYNKRWWQIIVWLDNRFISLPFVKRSSFGPSAVSLVLQNRRSSR